MSTKNWCCSITPRMRTFLCCIIVLSISYFTYFHNYYNPRTAFYDEHYYIVHAERYIHRIVFFDGHPPLGKMLIALGEVIFNPNKDIDVKGRLETGAVLFNTTDEEFSFVGVRFFPSLFGFLSGLLVFLIFYKLSKHNLLSLLFSSLYLFENSSIVQFRAAMLDSSLIFFSFITILYFLYLYEDKKERTLKEFFILGCLTSLAVSIKIIAMILVLLFFYLLIKELKLKKIVARSMIYLSGLLLVFMAIYYVHITLGARLIKQTLYIDKDKKIIEYDPSFKSPLGPTKEYVDMIDKGDIYNPLKLYTPMKSYFRHIKSVQTGIPKEDPTHINSNPIGWPIGVKNIPYIYIGTYPNEDTFGYLKFQGNPVSWSLGILAVLLSIFLIFKRLIFRAKVSNTRLYNYIFIFTSMYVGYMAGLTFLSMQRALYIHMYLIALFFSFILVLLVFNYIFEEQLLRKDKVVYISVFLLGGLIFYTYLYTYPVTYAKQLTYLECEKNRLVDFWEDGCKR